MTYNGTLDSISIASRLDIVPIMRQAILKRLYSIQDASVYLGRSPWTVAEMVRTGRLPYVSDGKRKC
jgi:hypothetical protein